MVINLEKVEQEDYEKYKEAKKQEWDHFSCNKRRIRSAKNAPTDEKQNQSHQRNGKFVQD